MTQTCCGSSKHGRRRGFGLGTAAQGLAGVAESCKSCNPRAKGFGEKPKAAEEPVQQALRQALQEAEDPMALKSPTL